MTEADDLRENVLSGGGENGKRGGLKIPCATAHAGSNPAPHTNSSDDLREKLAYYEKTISQLRELAGAGILSAHYQNVLAQSIIRRDELKRRLEEAENG